MPPDVRDHERVEAGPGIGDALEKPGALVDAAAAEHHVRERVLRPGLPTAPGERRERRMLRFVEQAALLVGERRHAVHVRNVRVTLHHLQRDPQHGRRVAEIEVEVLLRLDDDQIARKLIRCLLA